jgi:mannose/fructose/N-acetylgalactosamine-specific phosphotransferase system component IIC
MLVRLFRQFMSGQMISLIMGDCGSGMGMGGKIMQFYKSKVRAR